MSETKSALFIEAGRTGYSPDQVKNTTTIRELIELLEDMAYCYGEDAKVYLAHDRGYTFGGITWDSVFGTHSGRYNGDEDVDW